MTTDAKPTGPASYFPTELVAKLKADHGLGHGHANALVAWFTAQQGR